MHTRADDVLLQLYPALASLPELISELTVAVQASRAVEVHNPPLDFSPLAGLIRPAEPAPAPVLDLDGLSERLEVAVKKMGRFSAIGGGFDLSGLATETTMAELLAEFRSRYDVVTTAKATYTSSGDHTMITPPAGQSLRVTWLNAQAKAALDVGTVTVVFALGPNSYETELTGSQTFSHGAVWEGAPDQPLVVNTSSAAAVLVNVDYRVFG